MKERGILFSAPMVLALLAGRKTQTRRVINPTDKPFGEGQRLIIEGPRFGGEAHRFELPHSPGDRLWVREAWSSHAAFDGIKPKDLKTGSEIYMRADDTWHNSGDVIGSPYGKYRPARFMCRWMSRMLLEIVDVRIERLQSISEADAIAEGLFFSEPTQEDRDWAKACAEEDGGSEDIRGVWTIPGTDCGFGPKPRVPIWGPTPQTAYRFLWESINGRETWELNPWIIAYTFKEIKDENTKN